MNNRLPNIKHKTKISVICEGPEEYDYVEVFTQGSYANNTNVRTESDVDVCVMLKDVFHSDYPAGKTREDYGFSAAELTFDDYCIMVKRALMNKFRLQILILGELRKTNPRTVMNCSGVLYYQDYR